MLIFNQPARKQLFRLIDQTPDIPAAPDARFELILSSAQEVQFVNAYWELSELINHFGYTESQQEKLTDFIEECKSKASGADTPQGLINSLMGPATKPFVYNGERAELLANSAPPTAIAKGLLNRGHVTVLCAPPYSGKSWWSLNLGSAVASTDAQPRAWEGSVLNDTGSPVVYLSPDFPASELARRLKLLDRQRTHLVTPDSYWENIYLVGDAPGQMLPRSRYSLDEKGIENIRNELLPEGTSLLVIDTLSASLPHDVSENDNGGLAKVMGGIQGIASDLDLAILLIHHTAKPTSGQKSSEVWSSARGASAIAGSASSNILFEQHSEDFPGLRVMRTVSNVSKPLPKTFFEIRPEYENEDVIRYFKPVEEPGSFEDL